MIEVLCVVGAALLVLAAVNPATLFVNALPVGTDLTGHVVGMWACVCVWLCVCV